MICTSTRNPHESVSFKEALFRGLAPDGGLYRPQQNPDLKDFFTRLSEDISFNELAMNITARLLAPEIDGDTARKICGNAFSFSPRLVEPMSGLRILELFHGPSCAFKDFGACFLASAMEQFLKARRGRVIILTATSGDTGSAVAQAFHNKKNIEVVILYPSGRISPLQEKQLTTLKNNVTALEVNGSFDDCQRMAKAAFADSALSELPLTSANSINIGRLLPQSFYYMWAWTRFQNENFVFVVPSGNLGNLTAGLYAAAWGLPVQRFVAATNANDVLPEYLSSGIYRPRPSVATYSNAMDVGAPNNYERMNALYDGNVKIFRNHLEGEIVSDEETLTTMARIEQETGYLLCPHSAVGWLAAERYRKRHSGVPAVILSTAHPGKFIETVKMATGREPPLPPALAGPLSRKKRSIKMENTEETLREWLLNRFG